MGTKKRPGHQIKGGNRMDTEVLATVGETSRHGGQWNNRGKRGPLQKPGESEWPQRQRREKKIQQRCGARPRWKKERTLSAGGRRGPPFSKQTMEGKNPNQYKYKKDDRAEGGAVWEGVRWVKGREVKMEKVHEKRTFFYRWSSGRSTGRSKNESKGAYFVSKDIFVKRGGFEDPAKSRGFKGLTPGTQNKAKAASRKHVRNPERGGGWGGRAENKPHLGRSAMAAKIMAAWGKLKTKRGAIGPLHLSGPAEKRGVGGREIGPKSRRFAWGWRLMLGGRKKKSETVRGG